MRRTLNALLVTGALVLSGCGSSDDDTASVAAIADYLMEQQSQEEMLHLERADAECVARDMVEGVGVDRLEEYGLLDEDGSVNQETPVADMSREDAATTADAMFDCTEVMETMREELAASMGEQPAEVRECFEEALTREAVRGMLVASLSGDRERAGRELMGPLMECATGGMDVPQQ